VSIETILPVEVHRAFVTRMEIALIDLRDEATFALGHPLFAAQIPAPRLAVEAPFVIPRRDCPVVIYDDGEGLIEKAAQELTELGYTQVRTLAGGLSAWRDADLELFQDVNSYSKAFGELVESTRHTPSLPPEQVKALIDSGERMVILDARRFDEYATMAIPDAVSVPGAELVLRARSLAPDPSTRIIVNCAGRTRSLIGTQSLINAGIPNPVYALRNGTIGWTLAGQQLALGQSRSLEAVQPEDVSPAFTAARAVAYRAGVRQIDTATLDDISHDHCRTLYCFDVRPETEYREGHLPQFRHAPGGQLVQEIDMFAPVRGARIVLADALGVRSNMTASWLAQMGWEVYVLTPDVSSELTEGLPANPPPRGPDGRYKRPYEGTDNPTAAMQAYLEWEYGLVAQLERDGSHGFFVI
jgi:rhodanese-related sulfurtransferase